MFKIDEEVLRIVMERGFCFSNGYYYDKVSNTEDVKLGIDIYRIKKGEINPFLDFVGVLYVNYEDISKEDDY